MIWPDIFFLVKFVMNIFRLGLQFGKKFGLIFFDLDSAHPPVQTAPPAKYCFSKKGKKAGVTPF